MIPQVALLSGKRCSSAKALWECGGLTPELNASQASLQKAVASHRTPKEALYNNDHIWTNREAHLNSILIVAKIRSYGKLSLRKHPRATQPK